MFQMDEDLEKEKPEAYEDHSAPRTLHLSRRTSYSAPLSLHLSHYIYHSAPLILHNTPERRTNMSIQPDEPMMFQMDEDLEKEKPEAYEDILRRYRTLESAATRLQKEAKGYLDSLRGVHFLSL